MSTQNEYQSPANLNPWPHRLAILLACATFPLIWVGGLVTTYDAGMAVPDWPSTYGYNLFLYPWQTWIGGPWDLFLEHGHRLLGALVGLITLVMAAAVWRYESRRWVRWFAILCVGGVIAQGILGGLRVVLDERQLAMLHGCTGPAFFCLTVTMATITSRRWQQAATAVARSAAESIRSNMVRIIALAWLVTALAFTQIVVGAQLRHVTFATSHAVFRIALFFHIAIAVALFLHTLYLAISILRFAAPARTSAWLRPPAVALIGLVLLQIMLGGGSWVVKYGVPRWVSSFGIAPGYTVTAEAMGQAMIVTGHVAIGSLILATGLTIALRATRAQSEVAEEQPKSTINMPRILGAVA